MCQITIKADQDEDLDSGPLPEEPDPVVREQEEKKKKPLRMSLFSPDIVSSMMMIAPSKLRKQRHRQFQSEYSGGGSGGGNGGPSSGGK